MSVRACMLSDATSQSAEDGMAGGMGVAMQVVADLAQALRSSPRASVNVRGLTRAGPGEESRPGLAQARVAALKRALSERDTAGAQLNDKGWGGDTNAASQLELLIRP